MRTPGVDRRTLLAAALVAPITARFDSAHATGSDLRAAPVPRRSPSLAQAAKARGLYFGAAVRMDQITDEPSLRSAVLRDCAALTPEIHLKWNSLEWRRGEFNFSPVDQLLDFAEAHALHVRGHTLIWERSTPDWARADIMKRRDWTLVSNHFERVLGRYAGRVAEWDVVNEPIDTQTGAQGLRRTVFQQAFGATYIERALEEARSNAPHARLLINDYGFDYDNPVDGDRRSALLALVRRVRRAGAPLDGVGLQAHLDLDKGPLAASALAGFLQALADEGLSLTVTELDVKEADVRAPLAVRDQRVADEARRYLDIALAQPAMRGVVTWGLTDRHSWLSQGDGDGRLNAGPARNPTNRGLPYDAALAPKPMYWAMTEALTSASPLTASARARAAVSA